MLETTLLKIIDKNRLKIDNGKLEEIKRFMLYYSTGDIIYPSVFSIELQLDIKSTYITLEGLVDGKILERNYEVYCSRCNKFQGDILETISMVESIVCAHCGETLDPSKDLILIYRVK